MSRRRYVFDQPDRFVAGTVGEPGSRTFFLQARDGGRVVSVVLEKVQVAVLADRLNELLDELERRGITPPSPDQPAQPADDVAPLDEPVVEAFRAGTLTLGWDGDDERVLVEALEQSDEEDDDEDEDDETAIETIEPAGMTIEAADDEERDVFRVRLSAPAARSFVERAVRVVAAGRLPCPLCSQPLDPRGHICPRRNGHYVN